MFWLRFFYVVYYCCNVFDIDLDALLCIEP